MDVEILEIANKRLSEHVLKSKLDSLVVSSIELCLCFLTESIPKKEIWITISGAAWVDSNLASECDFFTQRSKVLSQIYMLIGKSISNIEVNDSGQLLVLLGNEKLVIAPSEESLEEVWSITPDNHFQFDEFDWYVTYTDNDELLVK